MELSLLELTVTYIVFLLTIWFMRTQLNKLLIETSKEELYKTIEDKNEVIESLVKGLSIMPIAIIDDQVKRSYAVKNGLKVTVQRRIPIGNNQKERAILEADLYYYYGTDAVISREVLTSLVDTIITPQILKENSIPLEHFLS